MNEPEPAEDIWRNFTVFRGSAEITTKDVFGKVNEGGLEANVKWFWEWIDKFHMGLLNGEDVGIVPEVKPEYILKLLERFFPFPSSTTSQRDRPTILQKKDNTGELDFVDVKYRKSQKLIRIPDSPGALAFIFSAAKPTTEFNDSAAVRRWVIPLLAVFSRCLYLAYIFNQINGTKPPAGEEGNINGVPLMSCAMWFVESPNKLPHYMLGCTYTTGSNQGVEGVSNLIKRRLMNSWRLNDLIGEQLKSFNPERTLPPSGSDYFLSPTLQEEVEKLLLTAVRGSPVSGSGLDALNGLVNAGSGRIKPLKPGDTWSTFFKTDIAIKEAGETLKMSYNVASLQQPPPEIGEIDRNQILNDADPNLKRKLRAGLSSVLAHIWSKKGDLNPKATDYPVTEGILRNGFYEIAAAYFVPHYYFVLPSDPTSKEKKKLNYTFEVPIATREVVELRLFATLWTEQASQKMIDMACRIYHWVNGNDAKLKFSIGAAPRWGRCAETSPACQLMREWFPERKPLGPNLGPDDESRVKGIAMETRAFNNFQPEGKPSVFDLETNFSWKALLELDKSHEFGLFKLPCRNCEILLPELDILVGRNFYDTEIYERNPFFQEKQRDKEKEKKDKEDKEKKDKEKDGK